MARAFLRVWRDLRVAGAQAAAACRSAAASSDSFASVSGRPWSLCERMFIVDSRLSVLHLRGFSLLHRSSSDQDTRATRARKDPANTQGAAKGKTKDSKADPERKLPEYSELRSAAFAIRDKGTSRGRWGLSDPQKRVVEAQINAFFSSASAQRHALELYVSESLFKETGSGFRRFLLDGMNKELYEALASAGSRKLCEDIIMPYYAEYMVDVYREDLEKYRGAVQTLDLRRPYLKFPVARALQRRIVYHAGPTNSGKTYEALQAFKAAESGVYCAPLRLLAMEVGDRMNADGLWCNLITGQERQVIPDAQHTACTVEMIQTQRQVDVAVIDEIQMIGDESRGYAWTRALQGLPAREVHLCGDGSAAKLVEAMAEEMGEPLEVKRYKRLSPLMMEKSSLNRGYAEVQDGDCIIAFSRRELYAIKKMIDSSTKHTACIIYGALPPEIRRAQARMFNDPDSQQRVLVASDAVGMGLNLNIRRIVFHSLRKYLKNNKHQLPVSQIKQIAGRAGRWGGKHPEGFVTCVNPRDMRHVAHALAEPTRELRHGAGLFPEYETIELLASQQPELKFSEVLTRIADMAQLGGRYFLCNFEDVLKVATLLDDVQGLTLRDRYTMAMSPCSHGRGSIAPAALRQFAHQLANGERVQLKMRPPRFLPQHTDEIRILELALQVTTLWLWLSQRYLEDPEKGALFVAKDAVQQLHQNLISQINAGIERISILNAGMELDESQWADEMEAVLAADGQAAAGAAPSLDDLKARAVEFRQLLDGFDSVPDPVARLTKPRASDSRRHKENEMPSLQMEELVRIHPHADPPRSRSSHKQRRSRR